MILFETVKASVSVPDAAKMYGLRSNHHGMVRCPFHDDRHPSLKLNEDYFYCFGCGATGDVIDLTARLFALSPYEAAKKLAADFGIDPDKPPSTAALAKPKHPMIRAFREDERYCQRVLCDYLHLLEDWKVPILFFMSAQGLQNTLALHPYFRQVFEYCRSMHSFPPRITTLIGTFPHLIVSYV